MTGTLKNRIEKMERTHGPTEAEGGAAHRMIIDALKFLDEQELDEPSPEMSAAECEALFDWCSSSEQARRERISGKPEKSANPGLS